MTRLSKHGVEYELKKCDSCRTDLYQVFFIEEFQPGDEQYHKQQLCHSCFLKELGITLSS